MNDTPFSPYRIREALEIEKPTMESYDAYAKMNLDPTSYPIVGSINILNEKLKNVNASS